jgi:hypothetical protein
VSAVMRCLEKKPEDRFQDVRGLAEALAPFAPEASISAERVARIVAASTPTSGPSPLRGSGGSHSGATSSLATTTRPSSLRAWVVVGVAVAGVAVGFVVFSGRSQSVPPPVSSQPVAVAVPPLVGSSGTDLTVPAPSSSVKATADSPDAGAAPAQPSTGSPAKNPATAAPRKNPLSVGVK